MPHNWRAYELAKKITEQLIEGKHVTEKGRDTVRGIIQITLEDSGYLRWR